MIFVDYPMPAPCAAHGVCFVFYANFISTPTHILWYNAEIRPALKFFSRGGGVSSTSFFLLIEDNKAIAAIGHPSLSFTTIYSHWPIVVWLFRYSFSTVIILIFVLWNLPAQFLFLLPSLTVMSFRQLVDLTRFVLLGVVFLSFNLFPRGLRNCVTLPLSVLISPTAFYILGAEWAKWFLRECFSHCPPLRNVFGPWGLTPVLYFTLCLIIKKDGFRKCKPTL